MRSTPAEIVMDRKRNVVISLLSNYVEECITESAFDEGMLSLFMEIKVWGNRGQKAGIVFNSIEDICNPDSLSLEFLSQHLGTGRMESKFQGWFFLVLISSLLLYFLRTSFAINEEKDQTTFSRRICL